jgi:hypothetical protein
MASRHELFALCGQDTRELTRRFSQRRGAWATWSQARHIAPQAGIGSAHRAERSHRARFTADLNTSG